MNLDAADAFLTKDLHQVAREGGYRTELTGKNHTYLKSNDVEFWREYGQDGGHRDADSQAEVPSFEQWLKNRDMNVVQEPTPYPIEVQPSYRIVSETIRFVREKGDHPFLLQVSFPELGSVAIVVSLPQRQLAKDIEPSRT